MTYYLINAVQSGKQILLAPAGSAVTLVRESAPAAIVEYKGNRFATTINNLTQTKPRR